jgi:hypothetical protein
MEMKVLLRDCGAGDRGGKNGRADNGVFHGDEPPVQFFKIGPTRSNGRTSW